MSIRDRDEVKNPAHYNQGGIECIDAIRAALTDEEFRGYCKGNAIKYIWRERMKGGDVSLEKGVWYMERSVAESEADALAGPETPAEHTCMIPINPNVAINDLPLHVIGVENDGQIAVRCDADGWIDWPGGVMPVAGDTLIEVQYRNGDIEPDPAGHWRWHHAGRARDARSVDIIRFRLSKEGVSE